MIWLNVSIACGRDTDDDAQYESNIPTLLITD